MIASQAIRRLWVSRNEAGNASAFQDTREDNTDRDYRNLHVEEWDAELADRISHDTSEIWN